MNALWTDERYLLSSKKYLIFVEIGIFFLPKPLLGPTSASRGFDLTIFDHRDPCTVKTLTKPMGLVRGREGGLVRGFGRGGLTRDISDMLHRFFLKTGIIVLGTLHILKIAYSFGLLKFALGDIDTKSFE